MGGGTSKPALDPSKFLVTPDLSKASYPADYIQKIAKESADAYKKAVEEKKSKPWFDFSKINWWKWVVVFPIVAAIVIGLGIGIWKLVQLVQGGASDTPAPAPGPINPNRILFIVSATYGIPNNTKDVTAKLNSMITADGTSISGFVVQASTLGLTSEPSPDNNNVLTVTYQYGRGASQTAVANQQQTFALVPPLSMSSISSGTTSGTSGGSNDPLRLKATVQEPPSFFQSIGNFFRGSSGGSALQSSIQNASSSLTIPSASAPLSVGSDGSYGMQWWMFIKDWNYGYGQQKSVIKRADPSSAAVTNPSISLHPTDNSLVISVSVFPATEGGASKSAPAPYGHSSATDDVFVCEVPNVPLQTWFSVSTTIFGRNLDVYIDGKLVKSCFMTGVPKPAMGDVQITPDGGFSGYVCDFTHFSRMLTPDDAIGFYNAGTNCQSATTTSAVTDSTGYSVKFGVYDATGKEVKEYAF